jgi:hypothetical protein
MKTLTVHQPWASLIVFGFKPIENRSWRTDYKGPLLIHSSANRRAYCEAHLTTAQLNHLFSLLNYRNHKSNNFRFNEFKNSIKFSSIIGIVNLLGCFKNVINPWSEPYLWNWAFDNPIFFPVPITDIKGHQSLWNYDIPDQFQNLIPENYSIDF